MGKGRGRGRKKKRGGDFLLWTERKGRREEMKGGDAQSSLEKKLEEGLYPKKKEGGTRKSGAKGEGNINSFYLLRGI